MAKKWSWCENIGLKKKLNSRDKHYLKTSVGRVLIAASNSSYNQRLETYYFQSAAARSCKTLVASDEYCRLDLAQIERHSLPDKFVWKASGWRQLLVFMTKRIKKSEFESVENDIWNSKTRVWLRLTVWDRKVENLNSTLTYSTWILFGCLRWKSWLSLNLKIDIHGLTKMKEKTNLWTVCASN